MPVKCFVDAWIHVIESSCDSGNILLASTHADIQPLPPGIAMDSKLEPAAPHFDALPGEVPSADAFIAEKRIGERIRRLRLKRSMGLVELGRHAGLSASFLSQLETGRVVPTLRNLARIAMVFGRDLSYFFEPEPHPLFRIHRRGERVRLPQSGVDDPTYYFESLAYMVPDRQLDPYYAEFVPPKKSADIRPHVHPGYEFLYLLQGELEIRHGDRAHSLTAGDSAYFDAGTAHSYRCAGTSPAVALIVTMHQMLPHAGAPARTPPGATVRPVSAPQRPAGSEPET
jgi:transcriptional regulator with XRE-family HTH domain